MVKFHCEIKRQKQLLAIKLLEGFKEAAEKFQEESGIEPDVDLSTLDNRILIREAVQQGNIQESINLVNQLHPELLDNDRYLYFHLQQLHLIELIRFVTFFQDQRNIL
jgi:glucose-induced degradation protein 8